MKKSIPIIREQEGNGEKAFPKFRSGKGMKKSIPIIRERESEASIFGNGGEREFPLTPAHQQLQATLGLYALSTFQVVLKPN